MSLCLSIFFGALYLASMWALACNYRTWRNRERVIDFVFDQADWRELERSSIGSVSYEAHLLRLFTLRDPWSLYPDPVATAMREGRA